MRRVALAAIAAALLLVGCTPGSAERAKAPDPSASTASAGQPAPKPKLVATITVKRGSQLERDIVPQLAKAFELTDEAVKSQLAAASSDLISKDAKGFRRMEGMISPGTYEVREDSALDELVATWVTASEGRYARVAESVAKPNDLSLSERLTLASMVDAECLGGDGRDKVAAAFLNRLSDHQRLQSCVTAEYAVGFQRPYLLNKDVEVKSAYNTYTTDGLPAGPICAVSDESLAVASAMSQDADVYYFFYDYMAGELHFFSDYTKFRKAAVASRARFDAESTVDAHDKVNKQDLYGKGNDEQ
ncbi:MAG TPA: endolytic transglycosylase MltG [Coriobacteriia bacterium]|nr:endolytic transglycosylase MltG [Coriobacteriia bacterium]